MTHLKRIDPEELPRRVEDMHKGYPKGLNCSEKVFLVVHSLLESDIPPDSVALMSGFGGGVAGTRDNMCGAVSGGVAAIGLVYGRRSPPEGSVERVYEVSKDFVGRFKTKFGTTICGELIGDLLRDASEESEEKRRARCSRYTLNGAKMCAETLLKYGKLYPRAEHQPATILGAWRLLSCETRRVDGTGEPTYLFGKEPHGSIVYTDTGRFSVHLMRRNRPRFASGDLGNGTDAEIRACYEGYMAYFGRYEVDMENGIVYHHVEGSLFPNWEGSAQKRFFKVVGNRLELRTPPVLLRGAETVLVLELERVST